MSPLQDRTCPLTDAEFVQAIERLLPSGTPPVLAVAISGGSDSLALTYLAHHWAQSYNSRIIGLTVDHGLRPESYEEAITVGKWLQATGIEHHILQWEGTKPSANIQSIARTARYNLMTNWCKEHNIRYLLTAHHADDQAETFLMRLVRGSGVDGLSAIPPHSIYQGIHLLRPLLDFPRERLRQYLRRNGHNWVEDPSNDNPAYTRTRIRNFLSNPAGLVDNPHLLSKRLQDTAAHMARVRAALEDATSRLLASCVTLHPAGYCTIQQPLFQQAPEEIGLRTLTTVLGHIGNTEHDIRFEKLAPLYHKIKTNMLVDAQTLNGCIITPSRKKGEGDIIYILREPAAVDTDIPIAQGQTVIWDKRFTCSVGANASLPHPLYIGALGITGYENIIKQSPGFAFPHLRKNIIYTLPALKGVESILAVPHISYYWDTSFINLFEIGLQPFPFTPIFTSHE